jgi:hypothetical protein
MLKIENSVEGVTAACNKRDWLPRAAKAEKKQNIKV